MNTYHTRQTEYGLTVIVKNNTQWIPCDPANADYQDYLAWVEAGNTAEPWEPDNAN